MVSPLDSAPALASQLKMIWDKLDALPTFGWARVTQVDPLLILRAGDPEGSDVTAIDLIGGLTVGAQVFVVRVARRFFAIGKVGGGGPGVCTDFLTAASQAEMESIATTIGAKKGLCVWRSDLQALMRHDGAKWTRISPRKSLAGSAPNGSTMGAAPGATSTGVSATVTIDGTAALVVVRANRVTSTGNCAGYVGVQVDGVSVGDLRRVYSSWGAFASYSPEWVWPLTLTTGTHTVRALLQADAASANAIYLDGPGVICWNI